MFQRKHKRSFGAQNCAAVFDLITEAGLKSTRSYKWTGTVQVAIKRTKC